VRIQLVKCESGSVRGRGSRDRGEGSVRRGIKPRENSHTRPAPVQGRKGVGLLKLGGEVQAGQGEVEGVYACVRKCLRTHTGWEGIH